MPQEQWAMQGNYEPWYVGWRICYPKASEMLQKFYETPPFIPRILEVKRFEWIFMGTPGSGANFHIDKEKLSSYQAQVISAFSFSLPVISFSFKILFTLVCHPPPKNVVSRILFFR